MSIPYEEFKPEYKIHYSKQHLFYYDEHFHPGRGKEVAQIGWRAIVSCHYKEFEGAADCCLGLNQKGVEDSAKELALGALQSKMLAALDK